MVKDFRRLLRRETSKLEEVSGEQAADRLARAGLTRDVIAADVRRRVRDRLQSAAQTTLDGPLRSELNGARPVKAVVTVTSIVVPGALGAFVKELALRGSGGSKMSATVAFVDAKTGATVLTYDPKVPIEIQGGETPIDFGGQGRFSADPSIRLFTRLQSELVGWLKAA